METILKKESEEFQIHLKSMASGGYEWNIEKMPEGIELKNEQSMIDESAVGSATQSIFNFTGIAKGTFELHFVLKRRWENDSIDDIFYKIVIE